MLYTAFLLGMIGSLHCVGMCGPLTLLLPTNAKSKRRFLTGRLIYNLGRVVTYAFLGILIGFIGEKIAVFVSQKWLSIAFGCLIITGLIAYKFLSANRFSMKLQSKLNHTVSNLFSKSTQRPFLLSHFLFGMANGLLPCGMVYAALAGAFLQTKVWEGSLYMILFGLGTLPLMFAASVGFGWLKKQKFVNFQRVIPVSYALLAIWLLVRGFTAYDTNLQKIPDPSNLQHCETALIAQ